MQRTRDVITRKREGAQLGDEEETGFAVIAGVGLPESGHQQRESRRFLHVAFGVIPFGVRTEQRIIALGL